ncbi:MAG: 4Fe-4S binding protein [Tannerella sp.]|jgi:2-oxoglutarate ferredoxin oxidoreductase subunit delta|nr:4Fe-4S binding protein [Tannerella sp.]
MRQRNFKHRSKEIQTKYIHATGKHCEACWKCVEACPQGVFGKVGFLFHKHIIIVQPDACTGCLKCVTACKYGVIVKGNL